MLPVLQTLLMNILINYNVVSLRVLFLKTLVMICNKLGTLLQAATAVSTINYESKSELAVILS